MTTIARSHMKDDAKGGRRGVRWAAVATAVAWQTWAATAVCRDVDVHAVPAIPTAICGRGHRSERLRQSRFRDSRRVGDARPAHDSRQIDTGDIIERTSSPLCP